MNKVLLPLVFSVIALSLIGYQDAYSQVNTNIADEFTCENFPVLGTFDLLTNTCVLDGTHTIPLDDFWDFQIDGKVTGTVNVNGGLRFITSLSNSGTINVIGDAGGATSIGALIFVFGTDYTNECNGIINLIGGTGTQSGRLTVGAFSVDVLFNNFGTITGTNSDLSELIASIHLSSIDPDIVTFNNHGTLTAPVLNQDSVFNDNLQNPCLEIGGEIIPINTTALLLAGVQSVSMWMIPVVIAGAGIGVFVIKRRN